LPGRPDSLQVMLSTQLDRAIATAKAYPRDLKGALATAKAMAIYTPESAQMCWYRKPVGDGKTATGGSIRLAEILGVCWGNIDVRPPIVAVHERHVEASTTCMDLERNTTWPGSCVKSVMYSKKGERAGRRYSDDQIAVTVQAAAATARRNAILACIPRVFWEPILEECRRVAAGGVKDVKASVAAMLAHFEKLGVKRDRVLAAVNRKSESEIVADDLVDLRATAEAIRTGELTVAEAFPINGEPANKATASAAFDPGRARLEIRAAFANWPPLQQVAFLTKCGVQSIDEIAGTNDAEKLRIAHEIMEPGQSEGARTVEQEQPT